MLVNFGIDRARHHGGYLEGKFIIRLFQNVDKIFKVFSIEIDKSVTNGKQRKWNWRLYRKIYQNMYTVRFFIFFIKDLMWRDVKNIIDKLEIAITQTISCWRNLRLSTKMPKIHGIEDYLFDQIKKYNGIRCFIGDFIEQAHQFGIKGEKRTAKMRDIVKTSINHSRIESISLNGEVKSKVKEVEWIQEGHTTNENE